MRRPWNIIDCPIYSLSTSDSEGKTNMNICTYVTAISMKPKMYLISIEYNSKTYQNLINTKTSYLQILNINQSGLVKVFGKKSGTNFNKNEYLQRNKLTFKWKEGEVLKDCCAYLKLKKNNIVKNDADHAHFFFDVLNFKTISESNVLSYQHLVQNKIIL